MNAIIKIMMLGTVITLLTSCEKFLDVNDNPNKPGATTLPLSAKFPAALVETVNQEQGQLNQIGALWGGYWGTNNQGFDLFFDLKTYNGPAIRSQRDGIPVWENGFNNILYFQLIKEEALETNELFYVGTAKIMQGWLFLRLVDVYNNIPFDEAVKGTAFITPKYEAGELVYQKAVNLITEGINEVKNSAIIGARADDLMFKGDRIKWAKFGNTIKLRALIRQSEAGNQSYIADEISKINVEGSGFLAVGEHAFVNPGYQNSNGKSNPFWASYYRDVQGGATSNFLNIRPTSYLLTQYKERNDPRLGQLYMEVNGAYKGVIFGNPDGSDPKYAQANTSSFKGPTEHGGQPGGLFKSFDQPSVLMGSFESLFLQAEATQRGWLAARTAKSLYEDAIKESFRYLGVPENEFGAYNLQTTINFDDSQDKISRIIEQKWLALNSINSIEAWNDFRRLGIPNFPATIANGVSGRPLRLMYPETERGTNAENVAAQGSDLMTVDKVWWDSN